MALTPLGDLPDAEDAVAYLFFDSDDDPLIQYGETWLEEASLLTAVCCSGAGVAFSRGQRVWVSSFQPADEPQQPPSAFWTVPGDARVTALAWPACCRPGCGLDSCLLIGTSSGRVLVYTPSGRHILTQRVHDAAVTSLSCSGSDVCLASSEHVATVPVLELQALLRSAALHVQRGRPDDEWAPEQLNVHKWDLRRAGCTAIADAVVVGAVQPRLHDVLSGTGTARGVHGPGTVLLLTAAEVPSFGTWAGPESEMSVLAAVGTLAVSAVSAVGGAMLSLLSPWGSRAAEREAAAAGAGFGQTQSRRSVHSTGMPGRPTVEEGQENEEAPPVKAISAVRDAGLYDPPRVGRTLALCPGRPGLAAGTDSLGRVILMDALPPGGGLACMRVFKGHRNAQIAFIQDTAGIHLGGWHLAILTPARNGQLELWQLGPGGDRVARARCGRNTRLLAPWPLLGAGDAATAATVIPGKAYILDGNTGALSALHVPTKEPAQKVTAG